MRKYAWLLAFALLAVLALLAACTGEAPSTPRSTITPTFTPPPATTTSSTPTQTGGIPAITHSLAGRENCLACHENGIAGSVIIPADHAGRTNETCTACHQPLASGTATATTTSTTTATATQPAGTPTIPHDLAGKADCLLCHQTGVAGATPVPANHAGRSNDTCTACHQVATASPSPTGTATATPTQTSSGIPQVPHLTDGFESCLVCHGQGIGGAPAVPADHAGRAEATCTACHTPAASRIALQYPEIEHGLAGREDCWLCHRTGIIDAPIPPSDHADRTNETCTVCHKVG